MKLLLRTTVKNGSLVLSSIIAALIVIEVFLNIYNPFPFRLKGDDIILPQHYQYEIKNEVFKSLDKQIVHSKNSMGFRGPERPEWPEEHLTLFTVGGSTTECFYLSDGKDWPARLQLILQASFSSLWINNAGLDGHSTYGHIRLLEQYIAELKPDVVLFLIGINDVRQNDDWGHDDKRLASVGASWGPVKEMLKYSARYSEVASLALNLFRYARTVHQDIAHTADLPAPNSPPLDNDFRPALTPAERQEYLTAQETHRKAFRRKQERLVEISEIAGILPILITQPMLFGEVGSSEGAAWVGHRFSIWGDQLDAETIWTIMESYNDETRRFAAEAGVPLLDLAVLLPKSTRYFYDPMHFTNEGAKRVAEILADEVCELLAQRFPTHHKGGC